MATCSYDPKLNQVESACVV